MNDKTTNETPLAKAVRLSGGQTALGNLIGRRQSTVRTWLLNGGKVPGEAAKDIEAALDGAVTREELRPEIFS